MKESSPIESALKILSRKRVSSKEISKKLEKKGFSPEEIEKTLKYLNESHYINDEELLVDYLKLLIEKRFYGPEKVVAYLRNKGFSSQDIREKLSAQYSENQIVEYGKKFIDKKFNGFDENDKKIREKIIRSLIYKGFNWDLIERILNR